MNQTQALAKLRKLLGPKLGYQLNKNALNASGREKARAEHQAAIARKNTAKDAVQARRIWLLANDAEYQGLLAQYDGAHKESDSLGGGRYTCPIVVGVSSGLFFSVKAEGDNWQEVVAKVEASKVTA